MSENFIPDIVLQDNTNQRLPCVLVWRSFSPNWGEFAPGSNNLF